MKKLLIAIIACACFSGCVVGFRSNMTFINHKNHATTEAKVEDRSNFGNGKPIVNADKNYEDLLNNSGNGNGQGAVTTEAPKAEEK